MVIGVNTHRCRVHSGNPDPNSTYTVGMLRSTHSTRRNLVHTLSCTLRVSATGTIDSTAQLVGSYRSRTGILYLHVYQYRYGASTSRKIHAPVSVRYRYRTGQLVQADAGGRQHAAHSARHALYRAEPNSTYTVGTLRVEIGPQWELSVYLLRLPR